MGGIDNKCGSFEIISITNIQILKWSRLQLWKYWNEFDNKCGSMDMNLITIWKYRNEIDNKYGSLEIISITNIKL